MTMDYGNRQIGFALHGLRLFEDVGDCRLWGKWGARIEDDVVTSRAVGLP